MTYSTSMVSNLVREPMACFSVTADNDPATLPRVLEVFAKRGLTPYQCYATAFGANGEDLHIDLQYPGLAHSEAEHMARSLRGHFLVKSVLTSQKQNRQIA